MMFKKLFAKRFEAFEMKLSDERKLHDDVLLKHITKALLPTEVRNYLSTDEALAIVYSIISLRGEFMYNLARTASDKPPAIGWYFENERKTLTERLCKTWPDKKQSEVEELVNEFYKPNK